MQRIKEIEERLLAGEGKVFVSSYQFYGFFLPLDAAEGRDDPRVLRLSVYEVLGQPSEGHEFLADVEDLETGIRLQRSVRGRSAFDAARHALGPIQASTSPLAASPDFPD